MIKILKKIKDKPYRKFYSFYDNALKHDQESIEAIAISSLNKDKMIVDCRFVNLKYIEGNEWTFFSNYNSPKAEDFESHDQISAIFYWQKVNIQIRIKAKISKSKEEFSDIHFKKRSLEKNALALSSDQSKPINKFSKVKQNYEKAFEDKDSLIERPNFWGGFTFIPFSFEFWQGNINRINRRELYTLKSQDKWEESILQP